MDNDLSEEIVLNKFNTLSFDKKIATAIILSNQLLPGYEIFTQLSNWGSYSLLNKYLIDAQLSFIENSMTDCFSNEDLKAVFALAPNSDNFSTVWSTYAQNASSSVYYVIEAIHTLNDKNIAYVPKIYIDVIADIVQTKYYYLGISAANLLKLISEDGLMQAQLKVLNNTIEKVSDLNLLNYEAIADIQDSLRPVPFDLVEKL